MKKIYLVLSVMVLCGTILTAQSKMGVGVYGAYVAPTGDFGDAYKSGFGAMGSLTYSASSNLQFSANVGYSQLSFNNEKFNQLLNDFFGGFGTTVNVDVQSNIKMIPILLGAKYFLTNADFKPYAAVDLGINIISSDGATVKVGNQTVPASESVSKAATAWGLGAGFLLKVSPKINLDVNAKINGNNLEVGTSMSASSGGSSSSQTSKSTATYFTVQAGLLFEL